jgi:hypothetical protein
MYSYVGPPTPTDKAGWLRVRFQRVTPPPGEDEITVRLSNQTFELLKGWNNIPRSDLLDAEGT